MKANRFTLIALSAIALGATFVLAEMHGWPGRQAFSAPDFAALWSWSLSSSASTINGPGGEAVKVVREPLAEARNLSVIIVALVGAFAGASRIIDRVSRGDKGEANSAAAVSNARARLDGELVMIESSDPIIHNKEPYLFGRARERSKGRRLQRRSRENTRRDRVVDRRKPGNAASDEGL